MYNYSRVKKNQKLIEAYSQNPHPEVEPKAPKTKEELAITSIIEREKAMEAKAQESDQYLQEFLQEHNEAQSAKMEDYDNTSLRILKSVDQGEELFSNESLGNPDFNISKPTSDVKEAPFLDLKKAFSIDQLASSNTCVLGDDSNSGSETYGCEVPVEDSVVTEETEVTKVNLQIPPSWEKEAPSSFKELSFPDFTSKSGKAELEVSAPMEKEEVASEGSEAHMDDFFNSLDSFVEKTMYNEFGSNDFDAQVVKAKIDDVEEEYRYDDDPSLTKVVSLYSQKRKAEAQEEKKEDNTFNNVVFAILIFILAVLTIALMYLSYRFFSNSVSF